VSDATDETPAGARPATPTTPEQLQRSIQVIRWAIAFSIVAIVVMCAIFVGFLDAPAVPLVPLAAFVVIVDLFMLRTFTNQRRRAIEQLRERDGAVPSGT
jgi:hypothetical protein